MLQPAAPLSPQINRIGRDQTCVDSPHGITTVCSLPAKLVPKTPHTGFPLLPRRFHNYLAYFIARLQPTSALSFVSTTYIFFPALWSPLHPPRPSLIVPPSPPLVPPPTMVPPPPYRLYHQDSLELYLHVLCFCSRNASINDVGPVSPLASSLAAGFSGAVAAAASHPLDTAKTRSHCVVLPKYMSMERKFLKWEASGNWIERLAGMSPADRSYLYRGIGLRMVHSGVSSFALVAAYLFAIKQLL
ncbi:hypothetical protein KSP39_PZI008414 [Platanthera zijinensis]|uniref:Uncharacterized protein n=1 Tax=Platanthera zijinensis TaxID=2320716 RepID=A0AAP0BNA5_9ASPA